MTLVLGCLALFVSAASPPAAEPDLLELAHQHHDPAHVLSVIQVESQIEDSNKNTVTVFGVRRDYRCPGGEMVSETRCDPCTYSRDAWAEHPTEEWIYEVVYGNDAEHQAASHAVEHFNKYFELAPRSGGESAGKQHVFFAYGEHIKVPPPPAPVAKLKMLSGGAEHDPVLIPYGSKEAEIEVQAFRRNASGALEPMPDAHIDFASPCATLKHTTEGRVLASLAPESNTCAVVATGNPGGVQASVMLSRELKIDIVFEGQAPDEVRLQHAHFLDLTFRATALDKPVTIAPQWKGENGSFEITEGGKKVRFTLDPGHDQGSVMLVDGTSGASDTLSIVRQP